MMQTSNIVDLAAYRADKEASEALTPVNLDEFLLEYIGPLVLRSMELLGVHAGKIMRRCECEQCTRLEAIVSEYIAAPGMVEWCEREDKRSA